jgi:hypothetical protein
MVKAGSTETQSQTQFNFNTAKCTSWRTTLRTAATADLLLFVSDLHDSRIGITGNTFCYDRTKYPIQIIRLSIGFPLLKPQLCKVYATAICCPAACCWRPRCELMMAAAMVQNVNEAAASYRADWVRRMLLVALRLPIFAQPFLRMCPMSTAVTALHIACASTDPSKITGYHGYPALS